VHDNWSLPCDAPLHAFVAVVGGAGLALTLLDFLRDVFKARAIRMDEGRIAFM